MNLAAYLIAKTDKKIYNCPMITDVNEFIKRVDGAADYIRSVLSDRTLPSVCIVLGSGLGPLSEMAEDAIEIPYKDIPGFPVSTAPGHKGSLIAGSSSGHHNRSQPRRSGSESLPSGKRRCCHGHSPSL